MPLAIIRFCYCCCCFFLLLFFFCYCCCFVFFATIYFRAIIPTYSLQLVIIFALNCYRLLYAYAICVTQILMWNTSLPTISLNGKKMQFYLVQVTSFPPSFLTWPLSVLFCIRCKFFFFFAFFVSDKHLLVISANATFTKKTY